MPFGPEALVMKFGGKIFAIIGDDAEPLTVSPQGLHRTDAGCAVA